MIRIAVDGDVSGIERIFGSFGSVQLFEGRKLRRQDLTSCDALIVRSVTKVDARLLADTKIKFVGSTTAGIDHIDVDYLARNNIRFACAPGNNAVAVAEYVLAATMLCAARRGRDFQQLRFGIVGAGHVGSALIERLDRLGIDYLVSDPIRAARESNFVDSELTEVLAQDVVTLHVPLTLTGAFPTVNLINRQSVNCLPPEVLLINAARGGVIDEAALLAWRGHNPHAYLAIDCWVGEPDVNQELLACADIATPHAAGYTIEARERAAQMIGNSLCEYFDFGSQNLGSGDGSASDLAVAPNEDVHTIVNRAYDLALRTRRFKQLGAVREKFDHERKEFGLRHEFSHFRLASSGFAANTVATLRALGFECEDA
ncbi:MAG: 4-phosphoerythronate dehydrogenase [Pseudomonadota bacterium]